MTKAYADRSRQRFAPKLATPRNLKAADQARVDACPLVVSFVGDVPWSNPTVYCDSGRRYSWDFMKGLHCIVAVGPEVDFKDALQAILERGYTDQYGYPVLVDLKQQEVACIVEASPAPKVQLWPVRRGSELWQQYFTP